jgi:hypothetical protein
MMAIRQQQVREIISIILDCQEANGLTYPPGFGERLARELMRKPWLNKKAFLDIVEHEFLACEMRP